MSFVTYPAPGKLNLFLHVTGRRADGYHLLQTVFRFIDYGDELQFRAREDGRIERLNNVPGIPAEADICIKAARLLQQEGQVGRGVEIRLQKRLPVGGGLGGGSSDAATVLLAMNRIWDVNFKRHELAELGVAPRCRRAGVHLR